MSTNNKKLKPEKKVSTPEEKIQAIKHLIAHIIDCYESDKRRPTSFFAKDDELNKFKKIIGRWDEYKRATYADVFSLYGITFNEFGSCYYKGKMVLWGG